MTIKKNPKVPKPPKPLTKLQLAERKAKNMEWAIQAAYTNFDELFALLCVYRAYIDNENFSKYTAKEALNGIFSNAIHIQTTLMDEAGLEW
jgi:hypothetical protein